MSELKPMPLSYTAIKDFEQCPRKFHGARILKKFRFVETEATIFGKRVHKAFEDYIKSGRRMDEDIRHMEVIAEVVRKKEGRVYTETKLALNFQGEATGYFDADVWMRGQADALVLNGDHGLVYDWKTGGNKYPDEYQLEMMAIMVFAKYPQLKRIDAYLPFVVHGTLEHQVYYSDDLPGMIQNLRSRAGKVEQARALNQWPETPSPLCPWCPDTECPNWRPAPQR